MCAIAIHSRPISGDDDFRDFWRIHDLLTETYPLTPLGFNWEIRRWEGRRFHNADLGLPGAWAGQIRLWQTDAGRLVAAVYPEGRGDAHIQIHPDFRFLEDEIVAWAEENLSVARDGGPRQVGMDVHDYDTQRQDLLGRWGWEKQEWGGMERRMHFAGRTLAHPVIAEGYTLRTTDLAHMADFDRIAALLNAAFNRDFHTGIEVHNFASRAPCFRPDLDLVAVAPDGSFAAYVGIAWDAANRLAIFEPVCTHPDHQRRGLAKTLMIEGLDRLQRLGAHAVMVGTGDMVAANRLYDSLGFTQVVRLYGWTKRL